MTSKQGKHTPGALAAADRILACEHSYCVRQTLDRREIAAIVDDATRYPNMLEALRLAGPFLPHNNLGRGEHCDNTCPKCAVVALLSRLDKEGQ